MTSFSTVPVFMALHFNLTFPKYWSLYALSMVGLLKQVFCWLQIAIGARESVANMCAKLRKKLCKTSSDSSDAQEDITRDAEDDAEDGHYVEMSEDGSADARYPNPNPLPGTALPVAAQYMHRD